MSRKKNTEDLEELQEESPRFTAREAKAAVVVLEATRKYSFEQWANLRQVKTHHRAGMKAFLPRLFPRSLDAWDEAFKTY